VAAFGRDLAGPGRGLATSGRGLATLYLVVRQVLLRVGRYFGVISFSPRILAVFAF
jgi:hypothetical protein